MGLPNEQPSATPAKRDPQAPQTYTVPKQTQVWKTCGNEASHKKHENNNIYTILDVSFDISLQYYPVAFWPKLLRGMLCMCARAHVC